MVFSHSAILCLSADSFNQSYEESQHNYFQSKLMTGSGISARLRAHAKAAIECESLLLAVWLL